MPAAINTAALFYHQFEQSLDLTKYTPLPCTIVKVFPGGSRVSVAVENPAQIKQTPMSAWATNHVPFVDTGELPPATGPFVTAVGYTKPTTGGTPSSEGGESPAGA